MLLDHLAVSGETLEQAQSYVEEALGVSMRPGGEHAVFHTHNKLMGLADGLYLEAIAINPDAPKPDRPRWFDLDRFSGNPRLSNWICRSDALNDDMALLPDGVGEAVSLQRGDLRWQAQPSANADHRAAMRLLHQCHLATTLYLPQVHHCDKSNCSSAGCLKNGQDQTTLDGQD